MNKLSKWIIEDLDDIIDAVIGDLNPEILDDDLSDFTADPENRAEAKMAIIDAMEDL